MKNSKSILTKRVVSVFPNKHYKKVVYYINDKPVASETLDKEAKIIKKTGKIPDGKVFQYDEKGKIFGWAIYKNEKYDKKRIYYNPNGTLSYVARYKNGVKHGISKSYDPNGKPWNVINYKNGKMNGPAKYYWRNGVLKISCRHKNYKQDGIEKRYNSKGVLQSMRHYKDGICLDKEINADYDSIKERFIGRDGKYRGVFAYLNNPMKPKKKLKPFNNKLIIAGIGGAGGNILNVLRIHPRQAKVIYINTDSNSLKRSKLPAKNKYLLGKKEHEGRGCGASFLLGERIARTEKKRINNMFVGYGRVILIAGLGGGTGSGMLPVIAEQLIKQRRQIFVITTLPFIFEGVRRRISAEYALQKLKKITDNVLVIPNQALVTVLSKSSHQVVKLFKLLDKAILSVIGIFSEY